MANDARSVSLDARRAQFKWHLITPKLDNTHTQTAFHISAVQQSFKHGAAPILRAQVGSQQCQFWIAVSTERPMIWEIDLIWSCCCREIGGPAHSCPCAKSVELLTVLHSTAQLLQLQCHFNKESTFWAPLTPEYALCCQPGCKCNYPTAALDASVSAFLIYFSLS